MINWLDVFLNSIWISGAALALAVIGLAYYRSHRENESLNEILRSQEFAIYLFIAGGLFFLGMALTSSRWWEIVIWISAVLACVYSIYQVRKNPERKK